MKGEKGIIAFNKIVEAIAYTFTFDAEDYAAIYEKLGREHFDYDNPHSDELHDVLIKYFKVERKTYLEKEKD